MDKIQKRIQELYEKDLIILEGFGKPYIKKVGRMIHVISLRFTKSITIAFHISIYEGNYYLLTSYLKSRGNYYSKRFYLRIRRDLYSDTKYCLKQALICVLEEYNIILSKNLIERCFNDLEKLQVH